MNDAARYLLRQMIAECLDHPNVYMGRPSNGSIRKAIDIIRMLEREWQIEVDPTEAVAADIERVQSWRKAAWDSLERI